MQAISLPASAGLRWVHDGFQLFRRQPMPMFTWALMVGMLVLLAMFVPPIGPVLFIVLMPTITVVTLQCCRRIEAGETVQPWQVIGMVRRSGKQRALLMAGGVYVAAVFVAGLVAFVPFIGGIIDAVRALEPDADVAALAAVSSAMQTPLILFGLFYLIIAALFWHAPVLIAWHGMGLRKALFFSGIACWRNKGAFILYGLIWAGSVALLEMVSFVLQAIGLSSQFAGFLQMPLNFAVAAVLYCSFYSTYTTVFEAHEREAATPLNP